MLININGKTSIIKLTKKDRWGYQYFNVMDGITPISEHSIPSTFFSDNFRGSLVSSGNRYKRA